MQFDVLYEKSIRELSCLDFESKDLEDDDEIKPEISAAITVVAKVFGKNESAVLEALISQRAQEAEEKRADDYLRYGNLNEAGETPEEAACSSS